MNLFAYLKVLIFPSEVRKKYGIVFHKINFYQEIDGNDIPKLKNIKKYKSELNVINNYNQRRNLMEKITYSLDLDLASECSTYQNKAQSYINRLNNLKANELPKNKDGTYSKKSQAGKDAQLAHDQLINNYSLITSITNTMKENLKKEINNLAAIANRPFFTWDAWRKRLGRYNGNKHSLIFMLIGFPVFFFVISHFNVLNLKFPTFENVTEIYIYNVFVGPVLQFFDLDIFKTAMFSFFISYDYALLLNKYYEKTFTFYNWLITALPMPIITFIVFLISYNFQLNKSEEIMPESLDVNETDFEKKIDSILTKSKLKNKEFEDSK